MEVSVDGRGKKFLDWFDVVHVDFFFFLSSGGEGSRKYGCLIPCVVQWLCGVWQQYECLIPFVVWWQWHGILLPLYGGMHSPNLSLPLPSLQHHWNLP